MIRYYSKATKKQFILSALDAEVESINSSNDETIYTIENELTLIDDVTDLAIEFIAKKFNLKNYDIVYFEDILYIHYYTDYNNLPMQSDIDNCFDEAVRSISINIIDYCYQTSRRVS